MRDNKRIVAVVLAAGSGKRMGTDTPKQFLEINGKPLLYYCLMAFQESFVDEIVLVARAGDEDYLRKEIVDKYDFTKVSSIVNGGKERYHSVAAGLNAIGACDYVMIHDGARPFVTDEILDDAIRIVTVNGSAITAVPAKDTVKIVDDNGFVASTPNRNRVFLMQTPQSFEYSLIRECYDKLLKNEDKLAKDGVAITDDAMVMEYFCDKKVALSKGDYRNIKITTPEDLKVAMVYMEDMKKC